MIYQHDIDAQQGRCILHVEGAASGPQMLESLLCLGEDQRLQYECDLVWDWTGIQELVLDTEAFASIHEVFAGFRAHARGRNAIVVSRDVPWMAAHYLRLLLRKEHVEVSVFLSLESATQWLGAANQRSKRLSLS